MTYWQGGSANPIYLCNDHAKALAPRQIHPEDQRADLKKSA